MLSGVTVGGHGSSQSFKLFGCIALDVFPVMPLDCGNEVPQYSASHSMLTPLLKPTLISVGRVQGRRGLISTPLRIRYQIPARQVWKLSGLPS